MEDVIDRNDELIRDALERYMDHQDTDTVETLQVLEELYPGEGYWTDQDAERMEESR